MCIVKSLFMEKLQTPHFECEVLYKYLIFSKHEYAICEYTGDIWFFYSIFNHLVYILLVINESLLICVHIYKM